MFMSGRDHRSKITGKVLSQGNYHCSGKGGNGLIFPYKIKDWEIIYTCPDTGRCRQMHDGGVCHLENDLSVEIQKDQYSGRETKTPVQA